MKFERVILSAIDYTEVDNLSIVFGQNGSDRKYPLSTRILDETQSLNIQDLAKRFPDLGEGLPKIKIYSPPNLIRKKAYIETQYPGTITAFTIQQDEMAVLEVFKNAGINLPEASRKPVFSPKKRHFMTSGYLYAKT